MPDGLVQRIDGDRELVYIVRRGRTYAAPLTEVEPRARVAGARVTFDLRRSHGSETASAVRLRVGSRTMRRHRRFGDLTGAPRPGSKVQTIAARSYGVDVATQPFRVAEAWLEAMSQEDHDGAVSLYLPSATLHTIQGSATGRKHIRANLERCQLTKLRVDDSRINGVDRYVRIECPTGDEARTTYLIIDHGHIAEQWIDVEPDIDGSEEDGEVVHMVARGEVADHARTYATDKIEHVMANVKRPVRFARVKLTRAENPSIEQPAMAEATIEFDGLLVRAHSTGTTFEEACDRVADRLAAQIRGQRDQRHDPVGREPAPGIWHHGNLRRTRSPFFDRPEGEREIVRHKSFATDEMTVDEAVLDMELLDYDFFLFVELGSGQDAVLERSTSDSLTVHRLRPDAETSIPTVTPVEKSEVAPPELAVSAAIDVMNASDLDVLFFRNRETGRGNVVYRRYDGHYGLMTPASPDRGPVD